MRPVSGCDRRQLLIGRVKGFWNPMSPNRPNLPSPIDTVLEMAEIDDGKALADPLFRHRYGADAPDFPCHVFAFSRSGGERGALLCYIHFTPQGDF